MSVVLVVESFRQLAEIAQSLVDAGQRDFSAISEKAKSCIEDPSLHGQGHQIEAISEAIRALGKAGKLFALVLSVVLFRCSRSF